jgi:hypothetical protein
MYYCSLPNSLEAKGLAPVDYFLSTQTVLSDSVLTIVAPKFFQPSLTPFFSCVLVNNQSLVSS